MILSTPEKSRATFRPSRVASSARTARAARQHNYELKVMRRIVQKYNGTMTTENQNVLSAVKIVLPPPKS